MFCSKCGSEITNNTSFCTKCGAPARGAEVHNYEDKFSSYGENKANGRSTASMVLGIISLVFWLVPLFGFPISTVGLVLGIGGFRANNGMGKAGMIMSIIGLALTFINSFAGAYMGATGRLF